LFLFPGNTMYYYVWQQKIKKTYVLLTFWYRSLHGYAQLFSLQLNNLPLSSRSPTTIYGRWDVYLCIYKILELFGSLREQIYCTEVPHVRCTVQCFVSAIAIAHLHFNLPGCEFRILYDLPAWLMGVVQRLKFVTTRGRPSTWKGRCC